MGGGGEHGGGEGFPRGHGDVLDPAVTALHSVECRQRELLLYCIVCVRQYYIFMYLTMRLVTGARLDVLACVLARVLVHPVQPVVHAGVDSGLVLVCAAFPSAHHS